MTFYVLVLVVSRDLFKQLTIVYFRYVFPLLDDLEYNLGVNTWIPFDYGNPSLYAVTYVVIVVALNYASHFVMVNDLIMQAHLMHLLCQFDVLADCFENILEDCSLDFDGNQIYLFFESFPEG